MAPQLYPGLVGSPKQSLSGPKREDATRGSGALPMPPTLHFNPRLNNDKLSLQVASLAAYGVHESDDIYDKPKDAEDDGFNLPLNFYYESLNSERNMFTSDGIKAMATYERALLEVNDWCHHPHSVPHLHPPAADRLSLSLSSPPASALPLPLPLSLSRSPQSRYSLVPVPARYPHTQATRHPTYSQPPA